MVIPCRGYENVIKLILTSTFLGSCNLCHAYSFDFGSTVWWDNFSSYGRKRCCSQQGRIETNPYLAKTQAIVVPWMMVNDLKNSQ